MVCTMITGSVKITTSRELSRRGSGRSSSVASAPVPSMPGSEYSHRRLMPVLNLS